MHSKPSTGSNPSDKPNDTSRRIADTLSTAAGDTTEYSFSLSNPKNYLGVPVAIAASGATGALIPQHLVCMAGEVKQGSAALGLSTPHGELTDRGRYIAECAAALHISYNDALQALHELKGRGDRFVDALPNWTPIAQAVFGTHPQITPILEITPRDTSLSLPRFAVKAATVCPEWVRTSLLQPDAVPVDDPVKALQAATVNSDLPEWVLHPDTYHAETTYQLKSLCYNAGLLTMPGADTSRLDPETDRWQLSPLASDELVAVLSGGDA